MRRSPGPGGLSALAVVVGWIGVLFAFRGQWLGVALPLVTTGLAWLALRRGEAMGRQRSAELQRALDAAAVRTRELERLRHLAATLLAGADTPGRGSSFWFMLPTEGPVRRPAGSAEAG